MDEKLLPCPFCGGDASMLPKTDDFGNFSVMCNRGVCMAEGSPCVTQGKAIAAWNTRAGNPRQAAAEALAAALKGLDALFTVEPRMYLRPIDHQYRMTYADSDRVDAAFLALTAALAQWDKLKSTGTQKNPKDRQEGFGPTLHAPHGAKYVV